MATVKKAANTTTGISVPGIPKIVSAVDAYKDAIKKKIKLSATDKQVEVAIKGTSSEASFKNMTTAIDQQMENLLNRLDKLTSDLDTILKNAYGTHDSSNQSYADVTNSLNQ